MVLIYSIETTPRMRYIFQLFFNELMGTAYTLTSDPLLFESFDGVKFSYGDQPLGGEPFIRAVNLLFEKGINPQRIEFSTFRGTGTFFLTGESHSMLPFDPFAAGFYLVSRYEEYLPFKADQHGRFTPGQSISSRHSFLDKAVVNRWAMMVADILCQRFPGWKIQVQGFRFIPTIDIDSAYAYKYKGLLRNVGGFMRSLFQCGFREMRERHRVLTGLDRDPFDTYDFQLAIHKKYNLEPVYFFLMGDYDAHDKNLDHRHPRFQHLIRTLSEHAGIGIHPSYASFGRPEKIRSELDRLAAILNHPVDTSRQHYLRLRLPQTYRDLIAAGITADYSMGYAQQLGFRAGICTPFPYYDLPKEEVTDLMIYPFAVMDGTLKDYMNVSPTDAFDILRHLIDEVKAVNGTFISLWHNESLGDRFRWKGWREVYEQMVRYAAGT